MHGAVGPHEQRTEQSPHAADAGSPCRRHRAAHRPGAAMVRGRVAGGTALALAAQPRPRAAAARRLAHPHCTGPACRHCGIVQHHWRTVRRHSVAAGDERRQAAGNAHAARCHGGGPGIAGAGAGGLPGPPVAVRLPLYLGCGWLALATIAAIGGSRAAVSSWRALLTAGRALLLSLPFAALCFLLVPRLQGALWSMPNDGSAQTGLADEMSPGSISELSNSEEIAFSVRFDGAAPPEAQRYWRGPVLHDFDGYTWRRRQGAKRAAATANSAVGSRPLPRTAGTDQSPVPVRHRQRRSNRRPPAFHRLRWRGAGQAPRHRCHRLRRHLLPADPCRWRAFCHRPPLRHTASRGPQSAQHRAGAGAADQGELGPAVRAERARVLPDRRV